MKNYLYSFAFVALMCIVLTSAKNYPPKNDESTLSKMWKYFGLGRQGNDGPLPQINPYMSYEQYQQQFGPCVMPSTTTTTTTPAPPLPMCPYPFPPLPPVLAQVVGHEQFQGIPGGPFPNGVPGGQPNPMFVPQFPNQQFPNQFPPRPNQPNQPNAQPRPFSPQGYNPQGFFPLPRPIPIPSTAVELNPSSAVGDVVKPEINIPVPNAVSAVELMPPPVFNPVEIEPVRPESPLLVEPISSDDKPGSPVQVVNPISPEAERPLEVKPILAEIPVAVKPILGQPEQPEAVPHLAPEVPVAVLPTNVEEPVGLKPFPSEPLGPFPIPHGPPHAISPQPLLPNNPDFNVIPINPETGLPFGPNPYGPDFVPVIGNQGRPPLNEQSGPPYFVDARPPPINNLVSGLPLNGPNYEGQRPYVPQIGPGPDQLPFRPNNMGNTYEPNPYTPQIGPGPGQVPFRPNNIGNNFEPNPYTPQIGPGPDQLPFRPNNGRPFRPNEGVAIDPPRPPRPNVLIDPPRPLRPNGGLDDDQLAPYPVRPNIAIDPPRPNPSKPFAPNELGPPIITHPNIPQPFLPRPVNPFGPLSCIVPPETFVPPGFSIVKYPEGTCGQNPIGVPPCSMLEMLKKLRLRTFATLVRLADLEDLFQESTNYTLYVPVDVSFELMPRWFLESLIADKKLLQNFLLTHFIDADVPLSSLGPEYLLLNKRPGGHRLRSTIAFRDLDYPTIMIDDAKILKGDIITTNGRLNIIDRVLKPNQAVNAAQYFEQVASLSNFLDAVKNAGLFHILNGSDPHTIFVPFNDAFKKLEYEELLQDKRALQNFCNYHIVNGSYYSAGMQHGQYLTTNYNKEIKIGVATDGFIKYINLINGRISVLKSDITATNAVIHIIDRAISSDSPFYIYDALSEFETEFETLRRSMDLSPEEMKDES